MSVLVWGFFNISCLTGVCKEYVILSLLDNIALFTVEGYALTHFPNNFTSLRQLNPLYQ